MNSSAMIRPASSYISANESLGYDMQNRSGRIWMWTWCAEVSGGQGHDTLHPKSACELTFSAHYEKRPEMHDHFSLPC